MENPGISAQERSFLLEAVALAQEAGGRGNLPIAALIVLDGEIVSRGQNAIWQPALELTRHAEMEALRDLPLPLRNRCQEMTLFTTLEPCLMCAGAILLHKLGRVVFGSLDPYGGVSSCLDSLPPYFKDQYSRTQWIGPALPADCDPLYQQIMKLEKI
jgi:tRNA(adenine34) deaminase